MISIRHALENPERTIGCFIDFLCKPQNHSLNSSLLMALMTGPILN